MHGIATKFNHHPIKLGHSGHIQQAPDCLSGSSCPVGAKQHSPGQGAGESTSLAAALVTHPQLDLRPSQMRYIRETETEAEICQALEWKKRNIYSRLK